ncbi:zinc-binding alcohol dehydrogenase family protein [Aspergillus lucknowensis]|uniref:Zinc-binding oxidoreductase n=1 Tax=Aspergillus lucknowensis TaxID=176173 RepID=A0ABR4LIL5_9EURO
MAHACIKIKSTGSIELVNAPIPKLRDGYILVKTAAVALNPTDWKHIDEMATPGATVGCDYSGTVQEVGPGVANFKPGDRVAGLVHGSNATNLDDGAFGEFVAAKADIQMKVPDGVSFEEAATLGAGAITAGQHLYQSLSLPLPTSPSGDSFPVLIYGGSTATGTIAIQLAKLSGLTVITTCSPRHFDLVRSLGADHVFDYRSPDAVRDVKAVTSNSLRYALDTVATEETAQFCSQAMGEEGGKYSSLAPIPRLPRDDVLNLSYMAFTAIGEEFEIGGLRVPARPNDSAFAADFMKIFEELWAKKMIKAHPVDARSGGLGGIAEGLQEMREGRVSGVKLVYSLS